MTLGTDEHDALVAKWTSRWSSTMWAIRFFTLAAYVANIAVNYLGMQGYFGTSMPPPPSTWIAAGPRTKVSHELTQARPTVR
jgi:hypothetical protein